MKERLLFRKYSWNGEIQCLCPSYFDGIIDFTVDGQIIFKRGIFLTTSFFNSPQDAQKYLSITYRPSYLYKWERSVCNQLMENPLYEFKNIYGRKNSASRIWPAFGKSGGGCEIIVTKGQLICPEAQSLEGGGRDEFSMDSYKSDIIFCSRLVEEAYVWFRGKKGHDEKTRKTIRGKIFDGFGFILKWIGSETRMRYAISCAYKEENNVTSLRFWGYIWKDVENRRYLLPPISNDLRFDCSKREILFLHTDDIREVLDSIFQNMKYRANNFETFGNDITELDLPPSDLVCISDGDEGN